MEYRAPNSLCNLCGSAFSRKGMTRHVKSCLPKYLDRLAAERSSRLVCLKVAATHAPDYFLHLLVPARSTFEFLDLFLRDIWLECCGHMSAFFYPGSYYPIRKRISVGEVLSPGTKLGYQYDFGSTTDLTIQSIDLYQGAWEPEDGVLIIARNAQPIVPCDACSRHPAVWICTECQWAEGGWLCETCAKKHDCDEEMFLPVVNSPRSGVCGYAG